MTGSTAAMIYQAVFQMGYVTEDLDQAIALFDKQYGIAKFFRTPTVTMNTVGAGDMRINIAMAWCGPTMIEIIQLLGGDDGFYRKVLPASGFAVRHHHVAIRLHSDEQWDAMLTRAEECGHPVMMQLETASTRALYLGTRDQLGHDLEYLYYFDEANSSLPRIPQNIM